MWVTQTYLGDVERDAKLFVYYFYLDYNSEQREFTENVQKQLETLGEVYRESVSLMMPNPRYAGSIEAEIREFHKLWEAVYEMLPGLLLSPVPLVELQKNPRKCTFVPFKDDDPDSVAKVIHRVRGHADAALETADTGLQPPKKASVLSRFGDAVEVKPGIWGCKLDLKKLFGFG